MTLVEVMPHASVEENKHNTSKCTIEEGELLSFFKTDDTGDTEDSDDDDEEGLICWFLRTIFSFSLSSSMSSELLICIFGDDDEVGKEEDDAEAFVLFLWL